MAYMYYADLEVTYKDGSMGAKRYEAVTMESVMKQAQDKIKEIVETSKLIEKHKGDKTFQVKSHRIKSGKVDV